MIKVDKEPTASGDENLSRIIFNLDFLSKDGLKRLLNLQKIAKKKG
jgi:hypothetical protein